ncbi:MAG TPA: M48 family metallopeptidase [Terriglobales bacterium]|nr:M48 family metallopeptidase [Terriglobales bacterium]
MPLRLAVILVCFACAFSTSPALSQVSNVISGPGLTPGDRPSTTTLHSYHDGSIRDIGAIGTRNIGCGRGIGNWYSLEQQIAMGREYSDQVEATSKLVSDSAISEYVNRIGQNLVRNSDSLVPFTIKVIESDDINAFALPGGFFYVDSGLILAADNEAELAGVMAHEIAHVAACHVARQNTRGKMLNMATIPLMMIGGPIGYAGYEALTIATPLTYLKFSRHFESEADFLGVQYMYKAGYDPQALTAFFEKIKSMERSKENVVAKAFRTHPQTPDRIEKTQAEINTLLPAKDQYKVDTSDFEDTKSRLENMENGGELHLQKAFHPTLRRREPDPQQN